MVLQRWVAVMATMVWVCRGGGVARAGDECGLGPSEAEVAAAPAWVDGALVADLPAGEWDVRVEVGLGPLRHEWTVRHTAPGGAAAVDLAVPGAAWLDDLAMTYLTRLVVRLTGVSGDAAGWRLVAAAGSGSR